MEKKLKNLISRSKKRKENNMRLSKKMKFFTLFPGQISAFGLRLRCFLHTGYFVRCLLSFFIFLIFYSFAFSDSKKEESVYKLLAIDISSYTAKVENKRIAVVPFSYADSTSSIKDGTVISERLSMELIKLKNEVIERNALEKVLKELKLENSGIVDPQKAVELGKILGVDFLITGTLVRAKDNKIEVNARIVEVETARAVKAFQIYVIKDWLGGDVGDKEKSPSENRFLIRRRR